MVPSVTRLRHPGLLDDLLHLLVVLAAVLLEQARRLGVGWGVGVGIAKQGLYRRQHGGDVVDGAPVALQDVEADAAVVVHVGVEQFGDELHERGLVRVVLAEVEHELEGAALPGCFFRAVADVSTSGCRARRPSQRTRISRRSSA